MATCDKKLVKSKSGLRMVTVKDEFKSPFLISEPSWVDDREVVLYIVSCDIMSTKLNCVLENFWPTKSFKAFDTPL